MGRLLWAMIPLPTAVAAKSPERSRLQAISEAYDRSMPLPGPVTVSVTGTIGARSWPRRPRMPVSSSQRRRPTSLTGAPIRNEVLSDGMTTWATPVMRG